MRYVYGLTSVLLAGGAALSLATGYPAGAQVAQNDASEMRTVVPRGGAPTSFADLTEQLQPAVVNISTRQRVRIPNHPLAQLFGQQGPQTREAQSLGSGFILTPDGYVVTNNHVITAEGQAEVQSITVTMPDGTEYPARLVGKDAASDLAVLKIERSKPFPYVKFGDSSRARVGDWVIAIGNPFGLGGTVTAGIVSAVYRNTGSGGAYDRYIQTDASINRGNSGGPMFDMAGNVIGVNNAIISPTGGSVGIGFAIPAEIAQPIVQKLMKGQAIERGYLGIRIQPLNEDLAESLGIADKRGEFVQAVEPGGAADKAGLKAGDVILEVDGKAVSSDQTLSFIVANIEPGKRIPITLIREGKRRAVTATVGRRPTEEELARQEMFDPDAQPDPMDGADSSGEGLIEKALGLQALELTPAIARQLGASEQTKGIVIAGVDPASDAGAKGLQRGDIVLSANYTAITKPAELEAIVREARRAKRGAILLQIQRRGRPATYVPVRLREG